MDKKTVYRYQGTDYTSINALRRAMPNVSLPNTLTDEQCSALNILKLELNYSTDEARAIRISQLYQEYQSELVVPTKYESTVRLTTLTGTRTTLLNLIRHMKLQK